MVASPAEDFAEQGNTFAESDIVCAELGRAQLIHARSRGLRRHPAERAVVDHHDFSAGVESDVEFDAVGALASRKLERTQGVFGRGMRRAAMTEHQRAGPGRSAKAAAQRARAPRHEDFAQPSSSSAICLATTRARSTSCWPKAMPPTTGWPPPP